MRWEHDGDGVAANDREERGRDLAAGGDKTEYVRINGQLVEADRVPQLEEWEQ